VGPTRASHGLYTLACLAHACTCIHAQQLLGAVVDIGVCAADADGQWRARLEIRRALETFDSASVDAATLGALVAGGYADLAVRNKDTPDSFNDPCVNLHRCRFCCPPLVLDANPMHPPKCCSPSCHCSRSFAYSDRGRAVAMICSCRQSTAAPCKREALGRSPWAVIVDVCSTVPPDSIHA